VPASENVVENCARGCNVPEFHPDPSDVVVCAVESVFVQVTIVPTGTSSWDGLNARLPSVDAPTGIVIAVDEPTGAGDGDGVGTGDGAEYPPPHALASSAIADTNTRRGVNIVPLIQSLASLARIPAQTCGTLQAVSPFIYLGCWL